MSTAGSRSRTVWEDRFRTPTFDHLRELSNKQIAGVVDAARGKLLAIPDIKESIAWLGLPWRWSLEYRLPLDPDRAWAVLVMQPNKPAIAIPLPAGVLSRMTLSKLPRAIRDGLRATPSVAGIYWPCWECPGKTQVDEVMQVVEIKRGILAAANA
ncbi:MAG: hypothetical protein IT435_13935 [Phycisphaerales bacterium]|nr:hypothetical protein [Phycisphaerales bacterium]